MHGVRRAGPDRTTMKFSAAKGSSSEIGFEPIGTSFVLEDGEYVILELPAAAVPDVEIIAWPNGIAVWVPFPGDYVVFDSAGRELDRL